MKSLWVIGSGGHAKVVIDTARSTGLYEVVGCLDDDALRVPGTVLDVPIVAGATVRAVTELGIESAVIAIGSNVVRKEMADRLAGTVTWETLVHPSAVVSLTARLGAGTVVFAGVVVQADAEIGDHVILNTGCTVDHDGFIEDFVHVGPGAHLCGGVRVGEGGFVGVGVSAIPGISVGAWSVVGAGAAVASDVPEKVVAFGVPARVVGPPASK